MRKPADKPHAFVGSSPSEPPSEPDPTLPAFLKEISQVSGKTPSVDILPTRLAAASRPATVHFDQPRMSIGRRSASAVVLVVLAIGLGFSVSLGIVMLVIWVANTVMGYFAG